MEKHQVWGQWSYRPKRSLVLYGECLSHRRASPALRLNSGCRVQQPEEKTPFPFLPSPCCRRPQPSPGCICCHGCLTSKSTWKSGCACLFLWGGARGQAAKQRQKSRWQAGFLPPWQWELPSPCKARVAAHLQAPTPLSYPQGIHQGQGEDRAAVVPPAVWHLRKDRKIRQFSFFCCFLHG